jgi:nucleoside recognition membrane protein YjiH
MIGLHDDCYHHRGLKVLSFWEELGSTFEYPTSQLPEYPDTLSSSVSWLVGYLGFLASALTISASVEPFSFVLGVLLI